MLSNLYVTDAIPGVGGAIKVHPEDFEVDELPLYPASGQGEHVYLRVRKRDVSARYALKRLAGALGVHPGDIGAAGIKDRRAVTTQWYSVHAGRNSWTQEQLLGLDLGEGMEVLEATRHTNKLKTGHLVGNRFRIVVRGAQGEGALERAVQVLEQLGREGMLNLYGSQRFGTGSVSNVERGMALLRGERGPRADRFERRLWLSAVQSHLFNAVLVERARRGLARQVLRGDVLMKLDSGGVFWCDDVAVDQARFDRRELVHTGPMLGPRMRPVRDEAAELEGAVLSGFALEASSFEPFKAIAEGTRRANLVYPTGGAAEAVEGGLCVSFTLPRGSYATILMDEVMKTGFSDTDEAA